MRAAKAPLPILAHCLLVGARARPPLRLGLITPMTETMGNQGIDVPRGSSFVVTEANDSGGVGRRRFEVLLRANKGAADASLAADKDLLLSHSVSDPRRTSLDGTFLRCARLRYGFILDAMGDSSMPCFIMTVDPAKGAFVAAGSVEGSASP